MTWIVIYEHRHGVDAWPIFSDRRPTDEEVIAKLDDWEPDKGETFEIRGPWLADGAFVGGPCAVG
jgi:hypothetical protein